ncbi:DUF1294 domain-containing protein [Ferrimonas senticii]|uniref:DUF1294 domain-containing protein n=1 Tax=Ferrimonas senticii TaxID=394566 RepID=UPI0004138D17|nr:DUF1294 domain-containing protein [Ferrimonas senticii]
MIAYLLPLAWFTGLLLAGPLLLLPAYLALSLLTVLLYGLDKHRAIKQQRRISERTLHLAALFGGWPGALFARARFRHKLHKRGFNLILLAIVLLHALLLSGYHYGHFLLANP